MAKLGRPKKQIDKDQFEKLCGMQCTEVEIAAFFDCDVSTLARWCKSTYKRTFDEVSKKKAAIGKISLRRTQWKQAENSTRMAIWLGKQYLGQTDKVETTINEISEDQREAVEEFLDASTDEGTTADTDEA